MSRTTAPFPELASLSTLLHSLFCVWRCTVGSESAATRSRRCRSSLSFVSASSNHGAARVSASSGGIAPAGVS